MFVVLWATLTGAKACPRHKDSPNGLIDETKPGKVIIEPLRHLRPAQAIEADSNFGSIGDWLVEDNELPDSFRCSTKPPTDEEWEENENMIRQFRAQFQGDDTWNRRLQRNVVKVNFVVASNTTGAGVLSDGVLNRQIDVLNAAFQPQFTFQVWSVQRVVSNEYFGCTVRASADFKRIYRRGGPDTLNLYTCHGGGVLGWSTMPFGGSANSPNDGVVVAYHTFPGGSHPRYNLGYVSTNPMMCYRHRSFLTSLRTPSRFRQQYMRLVIGSVFVIRSKEAAQVVIPLPIRPQKLLPRMGAQ
jgi:hypothetical protein